MTSKKNTNTTLLSLQIERIWKDKYYIWMKTRNTYHLSKLSINRET